MSNNMRPFLQEDLDDVELYLKESAFDWKGKVDTIYKSDPKQYFTDTLSGEEYEVAAAKKYFSDISANKLRFVKNWFKFRNTKISF